MQQESPSPIRKRKDNDEKSSSEKNKTPKSSVTFLNAKPSLKKPDYQIEPSSWIRKEITTSMLECLLVSSIFSLLDHFSLLLFNYIDALSHCLFYDIMYRPYTSESYIFYILLPSIYNPSFIHIPEASLHKLESGSFQ